MAATAEAVALVEGETEGRHVAKRKRRKREGVDGGGRQETKRGKVTEGAEGEGGGEALYR